MSDNNGTVKWVQFISSLLIFSGILASVLIAFNSKVEGNISTSTSRIDCLTAKVESYRVERILDWVEVKERLIRIEEQTKLK